MTTPVRTIPTRFPDFHKSELFNHKIAKASLFRKFAMAANYLWSRGRVYGGVAYEGNGFAIYNATAHLPFEFFPGETVKEGLCVATFFVPQCTGPVSTIQIDVTDSNTTHSNGVEVAAIIETLDGSRVSSTVTGALTGNTSHTFEVNVPQQGEHQCRIVIKGLPQTIGLPFGVNPGDIHCGITHVSARWKIDTTNYAATFFDVGEDFFDDNRPVSSVFLIKLMQNIQHLWANRQPELCQTYLGKPYTDGVSGSYVEVGRYIVWTPSTVVAYGGKIVVYCTSGGAGNEVRLKLNGSVVHTFTALAAGYTTLDLPAGLTMTDGQKNTFTVEAKSTDAANWGTCVWGVFIWEDGSNVSEYPTDYKPIDETGMSGDSFITAKVNNGYGQRSGIRTLFNNVQWLCANRFRFLVGDWRHKALKRLGLLAGDPNAPDERTDWTRGWGDIQTGTAINGYPNAPRNITIRADGNSTNAFDTNDALGDWPFGEGNAGGSYTETPFVFPESSTYYHQGRRLANHPIPDGSAGQNSFAGSYSTSLEAGGKLRVMLRSLRRKVFQEADDGTGLPGLNTLYKGQCFLHVEAPAITAFDVRILNTDATPDDAPKWLSPVISIHNPTTGFLTVKGWTPPFGNEGIIYEVELMSMYIEDQPLSAAQLAALS